MLAMTWITALSHGHPGEGQLSGPDPRCAMVGAQGEDAKAPWTSTWKQLQRHQANGSRIYG